VRRIVSEVKAVLHHISNIADNQRSDNQADQLFQHILDRHQPVRDIRAVDTVHRVMGFQIDKISFLCLPFSQPAWAGSDQSSSAALSAKLPSGGAVKAGGRSWGLSAEIVFAISTVCAVER